MRNHHGQKKQSRPIFNFFPGFEYLNRMILINWQLTHHYYHCFIINFGLFIGELLASFPPPAPNASNYPFILLHSTLNHIIRYIKNIRKNIKKKQETTMMSSLSLTLCLILCIALFLSTSSFSLNGLARRSVSVSPINVKSIKSSSRLMAAKQAVNPNPNGKC